MFWLIGVKRRIDLMRLLTVSLFIILIGGCSLIEIDEKQYLVDGARVVNDEYLSEIKIGKTTQDWVLTRLGYPRKRTVTADNKTQFTYLMQQHHVKNTRLSLLYRSRKLSIVEEYLHIEFTNAQVSRYWITPVEQTPMPKMSAQ